MQGCLVFCLGVISVLYLLNIGVGVFELIPDNLPLVGNLDEGGAVTLLMMCLRYFGLDVTKIFERETKRKNIIEV